MALVGGHRRRVQIASAALVPLVMAASAGIGQNGRAAASVPDAPAAGAASAQAPDASFGTDDVRAFRVSQQPEPEGSDATKPEKEGTESGGKVVYLTFDDGPSRHTKPVLRMLDDYDAKATFFLVGENAVTHPDLARSAVARGHAVGSHTWNHRDMRRLKPARLNGQIIRTSRALRRVTGRPVTCLRPPYGAVNRRVRAAVRHEELALKLWDVDPRDWKRPGAAAIAGRVVSRVDPGDVVLMHDGGGNRAQSVRALERILRALSKQDYTFATLPGC